MADIELLQVAVAPRGGARIAPTNLRVRHGEVLVVAGPDQAANSALLDVVEGLTEPDSGTLYVGGEPVTRSSPAERDVALVRGVVRRRGLLAALWPFTPLPAVTGASLKGRASVGDNLSAMARESGLEDPPGRLRNVIELLGLGKLLSERLGSLDAADQRRVALAVAMLRNPAAVLLDEPTDGLSTAEREPLVHDVHDALTDLGLTAMYATGDRAEAIELGDRIAFLKNGYVQQVGTSAQLAADPATVDVAKFVYGDVLSVLPGRVAGEALLLPERDLVVPADVTAAPVGEVLVGMSVPPERVAQEKAPDLLIFDPDTGARIDWRPERRRLELRRPPRRAAGRFLNVVVADARGVAVQATDPLQPGGHYDLQIDIGAARPESVIENAVDHPLPDLPVTRAGDWIDVVADADGFRLTRSNARLFLPAHGQSGQLKIGVELPSVPGSGTLRLAVYWKRHLLQTALMHVHWGPMYLGRSHWARIDYALSDLADVARLPERDLSLLLNDSGDGRNRVIVNHRDDEPFAAQPFEAEMTRSLQNVRAELLRAHRANGGGTRYDDDNAKEWEPFYEDLRRLATVGARLLGKVMGLPERKRLRARLLESANERPGRVSIQIVQAGGQKLLFPWHLVYDIPYDMFADGERRPCRFLKELDPTHPMSSFPARCPFENEHELNVVCPYGFWGFAHWVEMPPTLELDGNLPLCLRQGGFAHPVAVGLSLKLDKDITETHFDRLPRGVGELKRYDNKADFREALGNDERELIYLYCHGRREATIAEGGPTSLLEIGSSDLIAGDDINQWALAGWGDRHWKDTAPLVLINGCETVAMDPADPGDFVNPFIGAGAAGVIGTEVAMDQPVASEAAEELLRLLLEPDATIGSALQGMRRALVAKGNVMGLAYTAYCSASLSVSCLPANT